MVEVPAGKAKSTCAKGVHEMSLKENRDILVAGVQKAQERLAEIDRGAVQTVPGDIALAQIRQLAQK
jgi:hypothetical protein